MNYLMALLLGATVLIYAIPAFAQGEPAAQHPSQVLRSEHRVPVHHVAHCYRHHQRVACHHAEPRG
jgi:hypothetical protein